MKHFANPHEFLKITKKLLPWTLVGMIFFLLVGYVWAFFFAPPDYQQGDMIKLLYLHVPSAWFSVSLYAAVGTFSAAFMVWKQPVSYFLARTCAFIGIAFTSVCLITGSLWGKPMWGTWWVWDARLTSVSVLFFLYIGYWVLSSAFEHFERGAKSSSLLAIIGLINLPIIKWSVSWWNTLHQPASITKFSAPSLHISMILPLLACTLGWVFYIISLVSMMTCSQIRMYQKR
jgi:heme exporter protein C